MAFTENRTWCEPIAFTRASADSPGIFTDALELPRTKHGEAEAIHLGWERIGKAANTQCGPVTSMEVEVYSLSGTPPHWQITYQQNSATLGKAFVDGESGEFIGSGSGVQPCRAPTPAPDAQAAAPSPMGIFERWAVR